MLTSLVLYFLAGSGTITWIFLFLVAAIVFGKRAKNTRNDREYS